jgi:hypothetical protein
VTWKKTMILICAIMLAAWLAVGYFLLQLDFPGQAMEVMGVRSIFPAGAHAPVADAKNGWQGYGFAGRFRFFSRPADRAREDFQQLAEKNFARLTLKQELDLFGGGLYALHRERKGYRLYCVFFRGGVVYWADMRSADSLSFSRRIFERFILNLEIEGAKVSPGLAGQIRRLHGRISPFFMQTPGQLLAMMAALFVFTMLIVFAVNMFSGSCPRRTDWPVTVCTPRATLVVKGFARRQVTACCLSLEGESLVIYRFRRPFLKIAVGSERQHFEWEKNSLFYKNYRLILSEEEFQHWRSRLL